MIDARRHVVPAIIAVGLFAPFVWWAMDRDVPYVRVAGTIVAASPKDCGLADDAPVGLVAGACVSAEWKIAAKRACPSYERFNVSRTLIDSAGAKHILPTTGSIYARTSPGGNITRYFAIPDKMPIGSTQYVSSACFACNPLQHMFFPICVDKPELSFTISEPRK